MGTNGRHVRTCLLVGILALAMLPLLPTLPHAIAPHTPHTPIRIDGDADFTSANGVTGGIGTPSDPYMIEGWEINESASCYGISVSNTRSYFVIRNVSVLRGSFDSCSGIFLQNVAHARIQNSTVTGWSMAIEAIQAPGIVVLNNTVSTSTYGIGIGGSLGAIVEGNVVSNTTDWAIDIFYSDESRVAANEVREGRPDSYLSVGIQIYWASGVLVERNNVSRSHKGIEVEFSDRVSVLQNSLIDNPYGGVSLYYATNVTMRDNTFVGDGVVLWGTELDHFRSHVIDLTNLVSGKPVRYYRDCEGVSIDGIPTGQLIVANCVAPTIVNLTISGTDIGLGLYFVERANVTADHLSGNVLAGARFLRTGNSTVVGNNISDNPGSGAFLQSSWNVLVARNNISSNRWSALGIERSARTSAVGNNLTGNGNGINVYESPDTRLVGNRIAPNGTGIDFYESPNGTIVRNEVQDCDHGIETQRSPGTRAYHNSFVNNTDQAWESAGSSGGVVWNDTYPSGGNYWSNYTVADLLSGPNQDLPGSDGIGDAPFWFPNDSQDHYPLMTRYVSPNEPPFASFAVSPPAGDDRTTFTMDASTSWDLEDPTSSLQVRWDFEDDGMWDTPWSTAKVVQHQYPAIGVYQVRLQVQDTAGLTNQTTRSVNVHPPTPPAPGGLTLSRPNTDDIRLDWRDVPGATAYRVYESPDRFAAVPSGWTLLGMPSTPSFVAAGHATDHLTHYYLVSAVNDTEEGPSSTMGVKTEMSFTFNPSKTHIAWFSLPYNASYRTASSIANELGSANIDVVGKWVPATQTSITYYHARGGWRGTDFPIAPGDGLYLGIRASFSWILYGTDFNTSLSFALNPSPHANVGFVGLPLTGAFATASSIAAALTAARISEIGLWDPTTQTAVRWYWIGTAWTGTDFQIEPSRGVYLVVASDFTWTPALVTPARP